LDGNNENKPAKTYNFTKYTDISGETKSIEYLFVSDTDELINEVVVFFWSMHCGYSRRFIQRIKNNFNSDKLGVKFLFVNLDDISELADLKNFIIDNELQIYEHAFSGLRAYDDTYESFDQPSFPVAYVLSPEMKVTGIYR
jgi:hypothetical protein